MTLPIARHRPYQTIHSRNQSRPWDFICPSMTSAQAILPWPILKRFPIDTIKIDRAFVKDLGPESEHAAIAIASIAMAHGRKLRVLAEGVKTQAQLEDMLRDSRLFLQPASPLHLFEQLIRSHRSKPRPSEPPPDSLPLSQVAHTIRLSFLVIRSTPRYAQVRGRNRSLFMATYAIGDVQGCDDALQRLVEQIQFDPASDRLWFVGDLVNRGPDSLKVLRYIKSLGGSAEVVLGNHDLFLLAVAELVVTPGAQDTLQEILAAPDRDELLAWVRRQPLLYHEHPFVLVHAGLLPQWSIDDAEELAHEVETGLRSPYYKDVLRALYPSNNLQWSSSLTGPTRLATIIKVLTKLRACSADGLMESSYTGSPDHIPAGFLPWFRVENRKHRDTTIICGHWASLGLYCEENLLAIDSGCVWGRQLTAVRLEDREMFQVSCNNVGSRGD